MTTAAITFMTTHHAKNLQKVTLKNKGRGHLVSHSRAAPIILSSLAQRHPNTQGGNNKYLQPDFRHYGAKSKTQSNNMNNDQLSRKRPYEGSSTSNNERSIGRDFILNADGTVLHDHKGVSKK